MNWIEAVDNVKELYEEYKRNAQDAEPLNECEQNAIENFIGFLETLNDCERKIIEDFIDFLEAVEIKDEEVM